MSILYADIVNFTPLSETLSAHHLVTTLNQLFGRFDQLAQVRIKYDFYPFFDWTQPVRNFLYPYVCYLYVTKSQGILADGLVPSETLDKQTLDTTNPGHEL